MAADFDGIDFPHPLTDRRVALLDASAPGVVLADLHDELHVAAVSSGAGRGHTGPSKIPCSG